MAALFDILFGPLGFALVLATLGITLILLAIPLFYKANNDPFERLKTRAKKRDTASTDDVLRKSDRSPLDRYSQFLEPQKVEELDAMRMDMIRAGYRSPGAVQVFHFSQLALSISGLVIGLALAFILGAGENPPLYQTIMWVLGPGLVGYLAPRYWIAHKTAERIQNFTNGFPDALDMMLICVEAGQSLDQSIMRVAKELRTSFPVIAEEFELVSYEIRAGKDKNDVFKEMAVRVNVHDVNSFVTVLVQSQTFGTSISDAMRMYANEMRDKRVMRAEEKANTLPTKMSLATMVLTVPPLMMILIGPSIYRVVQTLSNGVF